MTALLGTDAPPQVTGDEAVAAVLRATPRTTAAERVWQHVAGGGT